MTIISRRQAPTRGTTRERDPSGSAISPNGQLARWGGVAGMAGAGLLVASAVVVGAFGMPDASDVETLTDYNNIQTGRIIEHFLYLGALMLFALHIAVLHRLVQKSHQPATLFGTVFAGFGLVIMAASSLLHLSTSPLAELYNEPGATAEDLQAVEYAWAGAQSVFDTMLVTGVLLVPIGIILFGVALRHAPMFEPWVSRMALGLGAVGVIGATIAVIDPGSMAAAGAVLAIVIFHLLAGWKTFRLADQAEIDLTAP